MSTIKSKYIFSESLAQHKMEAIKSKIQRYRPEEFISHCLNINNKKFIDKNDMLKHKPWIVNLAIKWSAAAMAKKREFRSINARQTDELLQRVDETLDYIPYYLETKEGLDFVFRNYIFQQGIYQHTDVLNSISRQAFIFNKLNKSHSHQQRFFSMSGISINDFLALSSALIAMNLTTRNKILKVDSFKILFPSYSEKKIDCFLDTISIKKEDLPYFAAKNIATSPLKEYFSLTPFLYKPYIKEEDNYLQVHPAITAKSMQNFIYDFLRQENPEAFMDKFGNVYESAIEELIKNHQKTYITEKEIEKIIPHDNKVDFIITNDEANIFIDAKGVEMSQKGIATYKAGDISSAIKSSVLKAITQSLTVNKHIHSGKLAGISPKEKSYIICVSFKDLLLGYGKMIYESFAKWEIDKIYKNFSQKEIIPYENIFCLAYEEFEYLLAACSKYNKELYEVLDYAIERNREPKTASFMFGLHLKAFFEKLVPSEIVYQEGVKVLGELASNIPEMKGYLGMIRPHQEL